MTPTRALASFAASSRWEDWPAPVRHETVRALVNWIGCPIWGSVDPSVERTLAALDPFSGPRAAAVLGRTERIDPQKAALLNGTASAVPDYDDTHLATVVHPTGPPAAALIALVEERRVSGAAFLHALALGIEVECRLALALVPKAHGGWYMTGVVGGIGAAVAAGRLIGLDEGRMIAAIGLAATRAAGHRETHGTMAKNLVTGFAAEEGLMAALLAERGIAGPEAPLEGSRGLSALVAPGADLAPLTDALGERFELMQNAYKPFPSGIVTHAAITGALELAPEIGEAAIERVALTVHPLCLELTGRREPANAVEGSFSVYHWVAVALAERAAGIAQFSDALVQSPRIAALRARIAAVAEPRYRKDEAEIEIALADGRVLRRHVAHALGAIERPPSDDDLTRKLESLCERLPDRGKRLLAACWDLERSPDAATIVRAASGGRDP
jgi:2-methylcitrate dehydratase PrpD